MKMKTWIRNWLLDSDWFDFYTRGYREGAHEIQGQYTKGWCDGRETAADEIAKLTRELFEQKITHNRIVNQHRARALEVAGGEDK